MPLLRHRPGEFLSLAAGVSEARRTRTGSQEAGAKVTPQSNSGRSGGKGAPSTANLSSRPHSDRLVPGPLPHQQPNQPFALAGKRADFARMPNPYTAGQTPLSKMELKIL